MKEYLTNSIERSLKERKEYYLYDIPIYILKPLPEHIDVNDVIETLKETVPYRYLSNLEGIYVGEFPELKDRKIQAMFRDDVIYLSSFENHPEVEEETILNNIIHEIAHSLEEKSYFDIYGDNTIEKEYTGKKKRLLDLLRANGVVFPGMGKLFFSDEHVDELDDFLFNKLGYDKLLALTPGLFLTPYSTTSLREYFAEGFEEWLQGDKDFLKEICPALYNKLKTILENDYEL